VDVRLTGLQVQVKANIHAGRSSWNDRHWIA